MYRLPFFPDQKSASLPFRAVEPLSVASIERRLLITLLALFLLLKKRNPGGACAPGILHLDFKFNSRRVDRAQAGGTGVVFHFCRPIFSTQEMLLKPSW